MALQVLSWLWVSALLLPFRAAQVPVNVRDRDTRAVTKHRGQFSSSNSVSSGSASLLGLFALKHGNHYWASQVPAGIV